MDVARPPLKKGQTLFDNASELSFKIYKYSLFVYFTHSAEITFIYIKQAGAELCQAQDKLC